MQSTSLERTVVVIDFTRDGSFSQVLKSKVRLGEQIRREGRSRQREQRQEQNGRCEGDCRQLCRSQNTVLAGQWQRWLGRWADTVSLGSAYAGLSVGLHSVRVGSNSGRLSMEITAELHFWKEIFAASAKKGKSGQGTVWRHSKSCERGSG